MEELENQDRTEYASDITASIELAYQRRVKESVEAYDPSNRAYSTYLSGNESTTGLDYDTLENLAISPQSDLNKTQQIIALNRRYVNKNDVIGITAESIDNNINTEMRLAYKAPKRGSVRKTDIEEAKALIADFNERINVKGLITRAINTTFIEGTFIGYRRKVEIGTTRTTEGTASNCDYVVDYYPLGVATISDYEVGGEPYVLIDMEALKSALQKTYPKNKKRKGLFYDNMDAEVQATYPPEVFQAYKDKEQYAKLDMAATCVLRIGNQNKKYGLSPIFRALYPTLMLEAFEDADRSNAKARSKKIIAQIMNKEILGQNYERNALGDVAVAHNTLLAAWPKKTVIVTAPPSVKSIGYIEPKVEMTSIDTVNYYRMRVMSTLGISFLMDSGAQSLSIANISLKQLMRRINRISQQLEGVLTKWYKALLADNGLDPSLAPSVSIIDSEMMEMSMKNELVNTLFNQLNCSYETAYNMLGLSVEDERIKREAENEEGLDTIFTPRLTSYTASGKSGSTSNGEDGERDADRADKTAYDQERYQMNKE